MFAQKCPICNGSGKVSVPWLAYTTAQPAAKICHGCNGKGWIVVSDMQVEQTGYDRDELFSEIDVIQNNVKSFNNVDDLITDLRN